jgi:hypothetical protein
MALQYSPKITTDGLVMCLDASQNKSYPTDLPVKNGLLVWLDAADDTTFSYSSGTEVSQWRDKSGNNLHANQATTANQPSRNTVVNSRKSVNFTSASGDFIRIPNGVVFSKYFTAVVLIKPGTQSAEYAVILDQDHSTTGYQGWVIQRNASTSFWQTWVANSSANNWTNANQIAYVDNTSQIVTLRKTSSTLALYSNGTSSGDVSINDYNLPQAGLYGLNIGYWSAGGGRYYNGDICEILVYNRDLTTTELKQVHTYLGQKWGISNTDRSIVDLAGNDDNGLFGNGTVANMPDYSYYNKGTFKFDGSADYINCGNGNAINFGSGDFSVEMWFTRDTNATTNLRLLSKGAESDLSSSAGFAFFGADSGISFAVNPSGTRSIISAASYSVGEWVHVVGVVERSSTMRAYKNAVLVGSATAPAGSVSNASVNLNIGRSTESSSFYWAGNIAIVRIYNKALTVAEITQNYEAQKSKFANTIVQQGLVLNLDVGNPYSYGGAGTTIYDVSATALSWTGSNVTYNSDPIKYFSYNGSSSWLQSSTSTAYDSQTITMECWCYPNTLSQEGFLFEKGSVNTQYSMFFESITNPNFVFRTMGTVSNQSLTFNPNTYLTVSAWNHIVCTYNGSSKIMYVNGVQVASVAASGTLPTGQVNQYIGRHTGGYFFNGRIGESRVYNIALSAAQVLQNYNATKGRFGL